MTAKMASLQHELSDAGLNDRVALLSITIDPQHDTPAVLKSYAQNLGASLTNWHFLRGTEAQTRAVADGFQVDYQKAGNGMFDHTALMIIVDPQGFVREWEPPDFSGDLFPVVQQYL
jgi:protein SCO1/2